MSYRTNHSQCQFRSEWIGAGILPPLLMNAVEENVLTGIIGALPNNPPNSTISPTSRPGTGIMRTAVVLLFMTPTAISSAMIAEIVSAEVEPGTATMSMPTEQTLVHASSLSSDKAPSQIGRAHV